MRDGVVVIPMSNHVDMGACMRDKINMTTAMAKTSIAAVSVAKLSVGSLSHTESGDDDSDHKDGFFKHGLLLFLCFDQIESGLQTRVTPATPL